MDEKLRFVLEESMLVRSVRRQGNFRWKKHDVFLTEVLWGEQVGLLPEDGRWFTIYFAQYPIAHFDSQQLRVTPLPKTMGVYKTVAGDPCNPSPDRRGATSVRYVPGLKCQGCVRPSNKGIIVALHTSRMADVEPSTHFTSVSLSPGRKFSYTSPTE
jgi:hypothetical protein